MSDQNSTQLLQELIEGQRKTNELLRRIESLICHKLVSKENQKLTQIPEDKEEILSLVRSATYLSRTMKSCRDEVNLKEEELREEDLQDVGDSIIYRWKCDGEYPELIQKIYAETPLKYKELEDVLRKEFSCSSNDSRLRSQLARSAKRHKSNYADTEFMKKIRNYQTGRRGCEFPTKHKVMRSDAAQIIGLFTNTFGQ